MAEKNITNKAYSNDMIELDCTKVSKIFSNLKKKGVFQENKKFCSERAGQASKELLESNDFIDHIKYYRLLQKRSRREIAIGIGIDDETYRQYELKNYEIQDYEIAEKMIKILNIENKVELPEYFKIMKQYPLDKIKSIIIKDKAKTEFSRETGISVSTINTWFRKNAPKSLSTDTYKKLVKYFKKNKIQY